MRAILQRFAASPPAALRGARCLYTAGSEAAARASPCAPSVFSRAPRRRFSAGAREASGCVGGFSLETRGEAGIVGDFEERRESAISPSSRPSVSRRPLPANFVEETFIPHLESQIVSMAPSFSPLQLAHVGGAYAKLPRALRDAQVEGRLLRRVEESLSSVNSAPEALAVLSLAESLWCGDETPASSSSGNEGFVRRVARRLAGDRGRRPVEAPLFMAIKKRLEIPAVESALSALNLLSVVRAFSKALRHEAAFSSEERSELETFVERSRLRAESLLAEFDAQELIDTVGAIALYRRPNREMLAFFALEEQRLRGAAQAEAASSRSAEEETASETDSVSVSNSSSSSSPKLKQEAEPPDAHLAVLPLLLVQIDRLLARDAFSFFQLLQLLHLLQKSGIKHELLLAECAHFLRTGTYLPKGITDADRDAESPPSEAAGDREKSAFLPSLQVEASELARLSVAEAPDFLRKLGRRIREAGLLDVRNGQQQSAPTAQVCVSTSATSSQTGVAEALPPSLLAKTLWIFAQLGELNLVEDVLERPILRATKKFNAVDFARLTQALPAKAPLLTAVYRRLFSEAPQMRVYEFLFFFAGALRLGAFRGLPAPDAFSSSTLVAAEERADKRQSPSSWNSPEAFAEMASSFFQRNANEFSPSQVAYALRAVKASAETAVEEEMLAGLLPPSLRSVGRPGKKTPSQ